MYGPCPRDTEPEVENRDEYLEMHGEHHQGGKEGEGGRHRDDGTDRDRFDGGETDTEPERCDVDSAPEGMDCHNPRVWDKPDLPETPDVPPVSVEDVARFAPVAPGTVSEPDGIGLAGMPLNVVSPATSHSASGELFGHPVTVRFDPVAATIDYGDGVTETVESTGATWAELGQAEFTPTATSHVYEVRGTYTVTVTVHYAATVDFGGLGTQTVPGTVQATAAPESVRIVTRHTGLVEHTCDEDPHGPGC